MSDTPRGAQAPLPGQPRPVSQEACILVSRLWPVPLWCCLWGRFQDLDSLVFSQHRDLFREEVSEPAQEGCLRSL